MSANLRILFLIAFLIPTVASADNLVRRGSLDIDVYLNERGEIAIKSLGSLADARYLALEPNDAILRIAGSPVAGRGDLAMLTTRLPSNTPIDFLIRRGGITKTASVNLPPMKYETLTDARVEYAHVMLASGEKIRTILTIPESRQANADGKVALVILFQDLSCRSIEVLADKSDPYTILLGKINGAGFATLRVEKPGVGDSEGGLCLHGGFNSELEAFARGLESVRNRPDIDGKRVFAVGVSVGAVQAGMLSAMSPIAGIATWGMTEPILDYWVTNLRKRWLLRGDPAKSIDRRTRAHQIFWSELLVRGKSPEQIRVNHPEIIPLVEEEAQSIDYPLGRAPIFYRELYALDSFAAWARYDGYFLGLHGEFDWVANLSSHQLVARIVSRNNPAKSNFRELPGLDHAFSKHVDLADSFANFGRGKSDVSFQEAVVAWLVEIDADLAAAEQPNQ